MTIRSQVPKAEEPLERASPVALHKQLAAALRNKIAGGAWKPGDQLPTEAELTERFSISRVTARQAVDQLVRERLVVRQRGKGTFVAHPKVRHELQAVRGLYEDLVAQGIDVKTSLVSFALAPALPQVASLLGSGSRAMPTWRRLYTVDGTPFAVADVHLALPGRAVTREMAEANMTYTLLERHFGVEIAQAAMTIRSAPIRKGIRPLLHLGARDAVLVLERLSKSAGGEPLEHTAYYAVGKTYEFSLAVEGRFAITPRFTAKRRDG